MCAGIQLSRHPSSQPIKPTSARSRQTSTLVSRVPLPLPNSLSPSIPLQGQSIQPYYLLLYLPHCLPSSMLGPRGARKQDDLPPPAPVVLAARSFRNIIKIRLQPSKHNPSHRRLGRPSLPFSPARLSQAVRPSYPTTEESEAATEECTFPYPSHIVQSFLSWHPHTSPMRSISSENKLVLLDISGMSRYLQRECLVMVHWYTVLFYVDSGQSTASHRIPKNIVPLGNVI